MVDATGAPRLVAKDAEIDLTHPRLMGIVNASPESFSDGRADDSLADQVGRALGLLDEGADILDVGGQSAITNMAELDESLEIERVVPLIRAVLHHRPAAVISVDAYRPRVVEAALAAGAAIVNDVSALLHPEVASMSAGSGAALVVMHTRARPKQRLQDPSLYEDVASDVVELLAARMAAAVDLGVAPDSIILDPGIDFSKTPAQSIELLQGMERVLGLGRPCLLALSRKDFIGALTGRPPRQRLAGTLAALGYVGWRPGVIYRVHDVAAAGDYLRVQGALEGRMSTDPGLTLPDEIRHERSRAGA